MFEFAIILYVAISASTFLFFTTLGPALTKITGSDTFEFTFTWTIFNVECALLLSVFWPLALVILFRIVQEEAQKKAEKEIERLEFKARNPWLFEEEIAEVNSDLS